MSNHDSARIWCHRCHLQIVGGIDAAVMQSTTPVSWLCSGCDFARYREATRLLQYTRTMRLIAVYKVTFEASDGNPVLLVSASTTEEAIRRARAIGHHQPIRSVSRESRFESHAEEGQA